MARYLLIFIMLLIISSCNREQDRTSYRKLQEQYKNDSESVEEVTRAERKKGNHTRKEYSAKAKKYQSAQSESIDQVQSTSPDLPAIALEGKYDGTVKGPDNKSYGYVLLSVNDQFSQQGKLNGVLYIPGARMNIFMEYKSGIGEVYIHQLGRGDVKLKNRKICIQSTSDNAFRWELQSFKTFQ